MNIEARKKFIKSECEKLRNNVSLKGNRLSVDSKIAAIFDEATFVETGAFVCESTSFFDVSQKNAEGVVTGYGAVNGRLVFACIQDYSRDNGALSLAGASKIADIYNTAAKNAAPVITVYDCDGAKLADGVNALTATGRVLKATADAKGLVPQIAIVTGVCSGGMAAIAENADIVIMGSKNACLSLSPVSVLKNSGSCETAGSGKYAVKTGLAAAAYDTEEEAFCFAKQLLDYLPSNYIQGDIAIATNDDPNRASSAVEDTVLSGKYTAEQLVSNILDDGCFKQLYADMGKDTAVGFGSIDGYSCGIIASNPVDGEKLTSDAAVKAAKFIELCDSFGLPVITVCDCDGYSETDEAKKPEAAADISALALAYAQSDVPMITVIAGKITGSLFSVLGSKSLGADIVFALPTSVISPMTTESAVEFMMNDKLADGLSKEELADKWETELSSPVLAAKAGLVDYICEPSELRARLAASLNMLSMKVNI